MPFYKVPVEGFQHQMKMVLHQAIGMNLPTRFLRGLGKGFEKILVGQTDAGFQIDVGLPAQCRQA